MNIKTYLKQSGLTQVAFAEKVDVTQGTVAHWLAGRVRIPAERCWAIFMATDGMVTVHDLRPDLFGPAPGIAPAPQDKAA